MGNLKDINYGIGKYLVASDASAIPDIGTNRKNLDLLNFKVAVNNAYTLYNFKDGMIDAYQTQDGVDTATSTNESYDSTNKVYDTDLASQDVFTTVATTSWVAPTGVTSVTYLVVAGGGGGGNSRTTPGFEWAGSGGGAGGLRTGTLSVTPSTSYTVTVGTGGAGASAGSSSKGVSGDDSVFSTITSTGGGGGGTASFTSDSLPGLSGGSGGGGAAHSATVKGGAGAGNTPSTSPAQGFDGGEGYSKGGKGGGGATAVGTSAASQSAGTPGGAGSDLSATFGTSVGVSGAFAGGGGGGGNGGSNGGNGGSGGGGTGGKGSTDAIGGTVNTGGGGGGGGASQSPHNSASGGTGIVIIKYNKPGMTLVSNTQTAQADPTEGRLMVYEEDVDACTPGTDIKGYVSRDGGTTWSSAVGLTEDTVYEAFNQGGIDSNTTLMLHCDGSNGGTTFTDSSDSAHTVTANGDVHTDTAVKKFGTASAQFDGTGDYLTIPYSLDFAFGSDDFTLEFWINTADDSYQRILDRFNDADGDYRMWRLYCPGSGLMKLQVDADGAGGGEASAEGTTDISDSAWHHVAGVRDGDTLRLYVDGVQEGTASFSGSIYNNASYGIRIGRNWGSGHEYTGYLDEMRISDICRYAGGITFTPPTEAYNAGTYTTSKRLLSGSVDISGQPAGSNMKYKVETLNSKNLKLHGASLLWA